MKKSKRARRNPHPTPRGRDAELMWGAIAASWSDDAAELAAMLEWSESRAKKALASLEAQGFVSGSWRKREKNPSAGSRSNPRRTRAARSNPSWAATAAVAASAAAYGYALAGGKIPRLPKLSRRPEPRFQPGDRVAFSKGKPSGRIAQSRWGSYYGWRHLVKWPSDYSAPAWEHEGDLVLAHRAKTRKIAVRSNPGPVKRLSSEQRTARVEARLRKLHQRLIDAGATGAAEDLHFRYIRSFPNYFFSHDSLIKAEKKYRQALRDHRYWQRRIDEHKASSKSNPRRARR